MPALAASTRGCNIAADVPSSAGSADLCEYERLRALAIASSCADGGTRMTSETCTAMTNVARHMPG
jgi:hypothetical protein